MQHSKTPHRACFALEAIKYLFERALPLFNDRWEASGQLWRAPKSFNDRLLQDLGRVFRSLLDIYCPVRDRFGSTLGPSWITFGTIITDENTICQKAIVQPPAEQNVLLTFFNHFPLLWFKFPPSAVFYRTKCDPWQAITPVCLFPFPCCAFSAPPLLLPRQSAVQTVPLAKWLCSSIGPLLGAHRTCSNYRASWAIGSRKNGIIPSGSRWGFDSTEMARNGLPL